MEYNFLFTLTMKNFCVLNLWSTLPVLHATGCKFDSRIFINWNFLSHVSSLRQQGDLTVKLQTTVCGSARIIGYVPLIFIFIPWICVRKHHYKLSPNWAWNLYSNHHYYSCTRNINSYCLLCLHSELAKYTRLKSLTRRPENFWRRINCLPSTGILSSF